MNESLIFAAALKLATPAERAAYLDEACAGNPQLRSEVEALLQVHANDPGFLEQPAGSLGGTADVPPAPGSRSTPPTEPGGTEQPGVVLAGRYKLLEPIGEGGMGTVWMAQQTEPVKRLVAVKLIKAGMDSKQVLARFEAERQALALMDHPNIAKVHDAGTAADGRPYFVMELVKGVPLARYCDEHRLSPRQRLELFVPICQAVQHAHQKGIIHRDLKPSNVLVAVYDGKPVPKVIDFGIAKAAGQPLTDRTLVTGFGTIVGTLEYMSPEQAEFNALDIDTRSDIYSLGVMLYELLTGSTPLTKQRLQQAAMAEMLRMIREEEPPRPSTRLSESKESLASISAQRHMEPAKLTKLVRGELDWIVMKALEKDRNRRYETANGFAADVRHYLADEPVQACPPSVGYRLGKLVRRNKQALATAVVLAVAVLVVTGTLGWAVRDRQVRSEAQEREAARQLVLTEQEVRQALQQATRLRAELHAELKEQGTRLLLNRPARWSAQIKTAQSELERTRLLAARAVGPFDPELSGLVGKLARELAGDEADYRLAVRLDKIRLDLAVLAKGDGFNHARTEREYTRAFAAAGLAVEPGQENDLAEQIAQSPIRSQLLASLDDWALVAERCKPPELSGRLLAVARRVDPDPWRDQVRDPATRKNAQAMAQLAEAAQRDPQHLGRLSPEMLFIVGIYLKSDRIKAAAWLRGAQALYPADFWLNFELANILDGPDAIGFLRAALACRPDSSAAYNNLGAALMDKGQLDEAIAADKEAIRLQPDFDKAHYNLGTALGRKGRPDEAITAYKEAIRLKPDFAPAHTNLGVALMDKGLLDEAITAHKEAIRLKPDSADAHTNLGIVLEKKGRPDEAIAAYKEAIRLQPDLAAAHTNLGIALTDKG